MDIVILVSCTLGIMDFNNWNNNWDDSWNILEMEKEFNNYNWASLHVGGAQSVTSQFGNALGEMASMAEACHVGQILNQSTGAFGNGPAQTPGQNANVPGAGDNLRDGQTLVTSLQNVLDTALQRAQSNGTGAQGATPGANAFSATQTSAVQGAGPADGTAGVVNAAPLTSMDQATFNDVLSRYGRSPICRVM